jgi:putative hydrolase of the HAD superfamily
VPRVAAHAYLPSHSGGVITQHHRAILFDFGGTLDGDGLIWPLRFFEAYRGSGGTLDLASFEPRFARTDAAMLALPGVSGLGFRAAIETQAGLLARELPNGDAALAPRMAERMRAAAAAVVARNRPLLERLSQRFRLGVVSNFTGNLEPVLEELDIRRFFRAVSDSAVVGISKPDPGIFRRTLTALGVRASEAWMVGDNPDADIRPALALGMRTCWVAPASRPLPYGLAPTVRVERLTDLEPHLA